MSRKELSLESEDQSCNHLKVHFPKPRFGVCVILIEDDPETSKPLLRWISKDAFKDESYAPKSQEPNLGSEEVDSLLLDQIVKDGYEQRVALRVPRNPNSLHGLPDESALKAQHQKPWQIQALSQVIGGFRSLPSGFQKAAQEYADQVSRPPTDSSSRASQTKVIPPPDALLSVPFQVRALVPKSQIDTYTSVLLNFKSSEVGLEAKRDNVDTKNHGQHSLLRNIQLMECNTVLSRIRGEIADNTIDDQMKSLKISDDAMQDLVLNMLLMGYHHSLEGKDGVECTQEPPNISFVFVSQLALQELAKASNSSSAFSSSNFIKKLLQRIFEMGSTDEFIVSLMYMPRDSLNTSDIATKQQLAVLHKGGGARGFAMPRQSFELYHGVDLTSLMHSSSVNDHGDRAHEIPQEEQWSFVPCVWYSRSMTRRHNRGSSRTDNGESSLPLDAINGLHVLSTLASSVGLLPKYGD